MPKMSLVKQAENVANTPNGSAASLPALFGGDDLVEVNHQTAAPFGPYVVFASPKSPAFPQLAAKLPGLAEPDPVLVLPDPQPPIRLNPFRFFLVAAHQYFLEVTDSGEILDASIGPRGALKEQIETVLCVLHDGKAVPARCTFRTTKCPAARKAAESLKLASTPDWANLSPEHAATLIAPSPAMRFTTTVKCAKRTAKSTGRTYFLAEGEIRTATVADWKALSELQRSTDGMRQLEVVMKRYEQQINKIQEKVK